MKILIYCPAWIGDMVMANSLMKQLKHKYPQCSIDAIAPTRTYPLLTRMPELDNSYEIELKSGQFNFKNRKEMGISLAHKKYDWAITLPLTWKSALVGYFAKAKIRTGYFGEGRLILLNDVRKLSKEILMVQRYIMLGMKKNAELVPLSNIPYPVLKIDNSNLARLMDKFKINKNHSYIAIVPGAEFGPAKRWDKQKFAEICKFLINFNYKVLFFGSAKDSEIVNSIINLMNGSNANKTNVKDLTGQTSILDAIDLISICKLVISNDTGLMHIASSLRLPLIVIYKASSPAFTPPLNNNSLCLESETTIPTHKRLKIKKLKESMNLQEVSAEAVKTAIAKFLELS